jgi:hypothetical protein
MFNSTHIAFAEPKYASHMIACVQNVANPEEFSCCIANLDITADIAHIKTICGLLRWIMMVAA